MTAASFSDRALAYLTEHAIRPEVAHAAGVREDANALTLPCLDAEGLPTVRRRTLNGSGPKVMGEAGRSLGLTWWHQPPETVERVIVCEGEADALAALSAIRDSGSAARMLARAAIVSVPSTGFPPDRLVRALSAAGARAAALAYDSDDAGRKAGERARVALVEAGITAFPVRLPEGADVADLLARVQPSDRAEALANALLNSECSPPPPVAEVEASAAASMPADRYEGRRYDHRKLMAGADDEPPWRVEPVAADGHLTILSARGGEGKSWAGLAWSGGVANGGLLAGLRCTAGRAVIFDAENGPYVLGSRLKTLDPALPADRVALYDAEGLRLGDSADRAWLLSVIRHEKANLVVLDSLRTLAPDVEENDSDAMGPIIVGAKNLARQSGAAVVLIVHRGHDHTRDFRGSTVIHDQADLLFVLERDKRDPEQQSRRRLRCSKCRIAEEPEDRWFTIRRWHGQVTLSEAEPYDPKGAPAPKRTAAAEDAYEVAIAADPPMKRAAVLRALGKDPRDRTYRRALEGLVEDGRLVLTENDEYVPPAEGGEG